MFKDNKLVLADFVNGEKFELNSYLTYLFSQLNTEVKKRQDK